MKQSFSKTKQVLVCIPEPVRWTKKEERLCVPTPNNHNRRLNVFGWAVSLLGKKGLRQLLKGNQERFIACLKNIYKRLKGYTIWLYVDRPSRHKGERIASFFKTYIQLRLKYLPSYQPGLNKQKKIWSQVRYEITTNHRFDDLNIVWESIETTTYSWTSAKIKRLCKFT